MECSAVDVDWRFCRTCLVAKRQAEEVVVAPTTPEEPEQEQEEQEERIIMADITPQKLLGL
jgi:hypothetical protein